MNIKQRGLWEKFMRMCRYKLIIPMHRTKKPPEHIARGTLVGLAWAFTPLVGVQMYTTFISWLLARKLFKWDFNLPVALAWTWVTNVFTMFPVYYVFYVTGRFMLGHGDEYSGYEKFLNIWHEAFADDVSTIDALKITVGIMVKDWGMAMMVGCIPWSIFFAWLGYHYSLKYARAREIKRQLKRQKKNDTITSP